MIERKAANTPTIGIVASMLEGMHGILTFVVGVASMVFHVWTTIIIYQTWGFKLAFPAFVLPLLAEIGVLASQWHQHHGWLTHYEACFICLTLGFVVAGLIGSLAGSARRRAPLD